MDSWIRWPLATVQPAIIPVEEIGPHGEVAGRRDQPGYYVFRNQPAGVGYRLARHRAAWRSLGETVPEGAERFPWKAAFEPTALRKWVRAYGPLHDRELDGQAFWDAALAAYCRNQASLWGEPDAAGVSRFDPDRPDEAVRRRARSSAHMLNGFVYELGVPHDRLDWVLAGNALAAVRDRIPMRRCLGCGHWIELLRADRLYCDTTCRTHATRGPAQRGRFREEG